jgi:N-acetylglutamate synthase-like GNAT family acetyltransferase
MEIITIDKDNIDHEHICCAITDKKGETCVSSKKAWMKNVFSDGLVFRRLNERGKVFIEYMPADNAWCPLDANSYMHINCFWVSGQFKGHGWANKLLGDCMADAKKKGKIGLTIVASEKKRGYLPDPDYMKHKGFTAADTAKPFFVLYHLPFSADAPAPKFKDCAREGRIDKMGMVLYYTNQCPHTNKYAPLIKSLAAQKGTEVKLIKLETKEQAQNAPTPFTAYSFFLDGRFVQNEIFSLAKFEKFLNANHEKS